MSLGWADWIGVASGVVALLSFLGASVRWGLRANQRRRAWKQQPTAEDWVAMRLLEAHFQPTGEEEPWVDARNVPVQRVQKALRRQLPAGERRRSGMMLSPVDTPSGIGYRLTGKGVEAAMRIKERIGHSFDFPRSD